MPNKSKTKGNAFEREVAKKLSMWITKGKDAFALSKRSGSGGAPRDLQGASGVSGDIQVDKKAYKWFDEKISVECKHYKDLNSALWRFICGDRDGNIIQDFSLQAMEAGHAYRDRDYLLIFKGDRMPPMAMTGCAALEAILAERGHVWSLRFAGDEPLRLLMSLDTLVSADIDQVKKALGV